MPASAQLNEIDLLWVSVTVSETDGRPRGLKAVAQNALLQSHTQLQTPCSAEDYFEALRHRVGTSLATAAPGGVDVVTAVQPVLDAGVACLEGFLQANLCGPVASSYTPLWQHSHGTAADSSSAQPTTATWGRVAPCGDGSAKIGQDGLSPDECWVVAQLEVDGEDVVGRVAALDLLLAALICLAEPYGHHTTTAGQQQQQQQQHEPPAAVLSDATLQQQQVGSWPWWAMRAAMLQQHVLSGRSITLQTSLRQLTAATLAWARAAAPAAAEQAPSGLRRQEQVAAKARALLAAAEMEVAAVQQALGAVADAQQHLEAAAAALGVSVGLTGAMGVRTKHQIDPKAQLVAAVRAAAGSSAAAGEVPPGLQGVDVAALGFEEVGLTKELEGMVDDSAVFLAPRIIDSSDQQQQQQQQHEEEEEGAGTLEEAAATAAHGVPAAGSIEGNGLQQQQQPQQQQHHDVSTLLQALLLGYAAQIRKGTSQDELQQWQMAPFVEAVLQQQHTQYMLHATARLLKCRHEKARGRTRERALMQLEQLCNALQAALPAVSMRLPLAFGLRFPLWPLLRKELAEFYIAMGFVGAALRIYEGLEMWDQLIVCYRLLDKKAVAQELVLARLKVTPSDAKLWCALGDITGQAAHYSKAWEVSGLRSSRAQRSLGRAALRKKEYAAAAAAYELALALNPLYPDVWFSLGYAYLKLGQTAKALQAFSKVTQQEPEHGEAWTNLAALWLQEGGWKEALHASQQAVKAKRDSWQTWDNYSLAAAKAGATGACVRGLKEVFELTQGQHFSLQTAEALVAQLEEEHSQLPGCSTAAATQQQQQQQQGGECAEALDAPSPQATASGQYEEDEMDAPEQLLEMLALSNSLAEQQLDGGDGASAGTATAEAVAAARQRNYEQTMTQLGALLKAVANSPSAGPGVWGLLGRWYGLQGEHLSSQEAWLKQVRALQSSPYKSDPEAFAAMATASDHLCRAYLATAAAAAASSNEAGAGGGLRELSAARMHLRGLLKQCEATFEEDSAFLGLSELLARVTAAENAALAAKKAAAAAAGAGK